MGKPGRPKKIVDECRFLRVRIGREDEARINELRYRWSLRNDSDTIRQAIAEAFERESRKHT